MASEQAARPPLPGALPRRPDLSGYLLAAAGSTLFAAKGIIIKFAYAEGINTETLLALRMALALPFYLAIAFVAVRAMRREGRALPGTDLLVRATVVGLIGYWIASYLDFLGLVYISAQFERLILFTYPGFVALFGAMFFGLPVSRRALLPFGLSYLGLVTIFFQDIGRGDPSGTAIGATLVFASAMAFAVYQLLAKDLIRRMSAPLFTCVAMSGAAVAALLQFVLTQPLERLMVGPTLLGYGVLLAIGATVLPSFLLSAALQRISAQANSVIGMLSPVVTIALAVALLGEPVTAVDALGTALVLAGVGWFTLADRRR